MEREPYEAVYRQVDPGRFEEAGLVVTSWLQGTSRDGDPQDHVHDQIARFRTYSDGKWRALDTMSVRGVLGWQDELCPCAGRSSFWVPSAAARRRARR